MRVLESAFVRDVAVETIGGIVGGFGVLVLGYLFIERRLHLRQTRKLEQERRERDERNRKTVLTSVLNELRSNAAQLRTALKELPTGGLVHPLFDTVMWPIVSVPLILTTLAPETIDALHHAYNRLTTTERDNQVLWDLNHGQTAILTAAFTAGAPDLPSVVNMAQQLEDYREEIRKAFTARCDDLRPHLDDAIDAVEAELGITGLPPAANRVFESN